MSGPISGALVNKFGCRVVTIMGSVLASVMLFLSIFAFNIYILYFTIGLGAGLGFGLIYLPAIVCVTGYFEKKRSFATGIAVCGSGLGTFVFSPLVEYLVSDEHLLSDEHLIEEYNWKGAMVIISALVLNCIFFGALFRPLEDNYPKKRVHRSRRVLTPQMSVEPPSPDPASPHLVPKVEFIAQVKEALMKEEIHLIATGQVRLRRGQPIHSFICRLIPVFGACACVF
ncbi:Major facilitator superfamily [Trinorchestia longiramus]|nr:Major facilitator superfamily [Trinorchestia longiramus]